MAAAAAAVLGLLGPFIPNLIDKIPTGKGKREAAASFLAPDSVSLNNLCDLLEISANSGESLPPVAIKILAERLRLTVANMEVAVAAIRHDTPEKK